MSAFLPTTRLPRTPSRPRARAPQRDPRTPRLIEIARAENARCAGLIGHIAEEIHRPVANSIYLAVDRDARYVPPEGDS
jgi:hypothetical protein